MKARNLLILLTLVVFLLIAGGCISKETGSVKVAQNNADITGITIEAETDTIYQFSTINALLEGIYDGEISCGELKEKGDFGLGTFNNLDGEMLELDGTIYQVKADGNVYVAEDNETSPFAVVTFFETDIEDNISEQMERQQVEEYIEELLPSSNVMYAVKISGEFSYMKTRSVPPQEKPYPRLVDVTKNQSVFEFNTTEEGTIIGYWLPDFVSGINVPGYHLHFLNEDKTAGGHILEYTINSGKIELDMTDEIKLELPENEDYLRMGFLQDTEGELEEAEN